MMRNNNIHHHFPRDFQSQGGPTTEDCWNPESYSPLDTDNEGSEYDTNSSGLMSSQSRWMDRMVQQSFDNVVRTTGISTSHNLTRIKSDRTKRMMGSSTAVSDELMPSYNNEQQTHMTKDPSELLMTLSNASSSGIVARRASSLSTTPSLGAGMVSPYSCNKSTTSVNNESNSSTASRTKVGGGGGSGQSLLPPPPPDVSDASVASRRSSTIGTQHPWNVPHPSLEDVDEIDDMDPNAAGMNTFGMVDPSSAMYDEYDAEYDLGVSQQAFPGYAPSQRPLNAPFYPSGNPYGLNRRRLNHPRMPRMMTSPYEGLLDDQMFENFENDFDVEDDDQLRWMNQYMEQLEAEYRNEQQQLQQLLRATDQIHDQALDGSMQPLQAGDAEDEEDEFHSMSPQAIAFGKGKPNDSEQGLIPGLPGSLKPMQFWKQRQQLLQKRLLMTSQQQPYRRMMMPPPLGQPGMRRGMMPNTMMMMGGGQQPMMFPQSRLPHRNPLMLQQRRNSQLQSDSRFSSNSSSSSGSVDRKQQLIGRPSHFEGSATGSVSASLSASATASTTGSVATKSDSDRSIKRPLPNQPSSLKGNSLSQDNATSNKKQKKPRQKKCKTFPVKFMEAIQEVGNSKEDIVGWLPDGKSIVIVDPELFLQVIVQPPHFVNSTPTANQTKEKMKYESFVRKLNRWGFTRLASGTGMDCFYHPYFHRDHPELAAKIEQVHHILAAEADTAKESGNDGLNPLSDNLAASLSSTKSQDGTNSSTESIATTAGFYGSRYNDMLSSKDPPSLNGLEYFIERKRRRVAAMEETIAAMTARSMNDKMNGSIIGSTTPWFPTSSNVKKESQL